MQGKRGGPTQKAASGMLDGEEIGAVCQGVVPTPPIFQPLRSSFTKAHAKAENASASVLTMKMIPLSGVFWIN